MYKILFLALILASCSSADKSNAIFDPSKYLEGEKVVMISHPSCHFCQNAFSDFTPDIQEILKEKAIFITPIPVEYNRSELEAVRQWNRFHPLFKHQTVYSNQSLPKLDLTSFPQFIRFKNGEVIGKMKGWRRDGKSLPRLRELISGL
jgi:thioredoxin-related protein